MLSNLELSGIEIDTAAIPLRTDGRRVTWSFRELEQARTFAQGLHVIVIHRFTAAEVDAAQAKTRAGRGLRWPPFVGLWGAECCGWLHQHSDSIRVELARASGRQTQALAIAGQIIITCRGYAVENAQGAQAGAAGERGQAEGVAAGRLQIKDAAPAAGAAAVGAAGGGGRNDKREREAGASEREEGEVSGSGEEGEGEQMHE